MITNGIANPCKQKQKIYEKTLKHRTHINEANYKAYKNLFETINANLKNGFIRKKIQTFKVMPIKHGAS